MPKYGLYTGCFCKNLFGNADTKTPAEAGVHFQEYLTSLRQYVNGDDDA